MTEPYRLRVAGPAARAIEKALPESIAVAVVEFLTGSLVTAPRRVGKPLRRELTGLYGARRGAYRILYSIDDVERMITVVRVEHRADVYRRR